MKNLSFSLLIWCCIACSPNSTLIDYSPTFPVETFLVNPEGIEGEISSPMITPDKVRRTFWVKLQTKPECLIGHIDQLRIFRDRIYILDREQTKSLYVFDSKGNFLFRPGSPGRGPGEYYEPTQFYIDSLANRLAILDAQMKRVHWYNLADGLFLKSVKLDNSFYFCSGVVFDSLVVAFDQHLINPRKGEAQYHLNFFRNDTVFGFKPLLRDYQFISKDVFSVTNNKVYYNPIRCDTIFEINRYGVERAMYIDFGKYALPQNFQYADDPEEQAVQLLKSKFVIAISGVLETSRYLFFSYTLQTINRTVCIEKATKRVFRDLRYADMVAYRFIGSFGEYLVAAEYNYPEKWNRGNASYRAFLDSVHFAEHKEVVSTLREGDNPILHFVDLSL